MAKKKTEPPKQSRHICARCRKKRYEDRMECIFAHPILTGNRPIWACKEWGYRDACIEPIKRELLMYQNTGLLHIAEVKI